MSFLHAIILSIVEGFSEFLPISSTGHLILAAKLLLVPQTDFVKSFEIFIQLGAILAVVVLYWRRVWENKKSWKPLFFAFIPTVVIGGLLYKLIKSYLLGNTGVVLWALFLGGIALIAIEYWLKGRIERVNKIEDVTPTNAFIIGLFQSIAVIPGVSRAAATIIGAMLLGTKRETAVEFSFLLAIPTMAAATGLDLIKTNFSYTSSEWGLLAAGFIGSFIVAILAVKFFLKFIQTHTFIPFGVYRIVLAILFFAFIR